MKYEGTQIDGKQLFSIKKLTWKSLIMYSGTKLKVETPDGIMKMVGVSLSDQKVICIPFLREKTSVKTSVSSSVKNYPIDKIKPILRKSLSKSVWSKYKKKIAAQTPKSIDNGIRYLYQQHYDVRGLIDAGLAISMRKKQGDLKLRNKRIYY